MQQISRFMARLAMLALVCTGSAHAAPDMMELERGIWIDRDRIQALPMSGDAWDALIEDADRPTPSPDLSNQDDNTNAYVLAKALAYARTGKQSYRKDVIQACTDAMGTEDGGQSLALGRELIAYVIAADLVGLPKRDDARFRDWLRAVRDKVMADGRTLRRTHAQRPNNWGTHAGASRIAVAAYLRDAEDVEEAARIFRGWLGDRAAYAGFRFRDLDWQANPAEPVGVNPAGASRDGRSIDGVLPDDQRRGGDFQWPPPAENYVYEALQGALAQAVLLTRAGYDAFQWEDQALLRAYRWLHGQADYPAAGDDTWQPHVINLAYGAAFPAPLPSRHGKNVGYTDWTHAPGSGALQQSPLATPTNLRVVD